MTRRVLRDTYLITATVSLSVAKGLPEQIGNQTAEHRRVGDIPAMTSRHPLGKLARFERAADDPTTGARCRRRVCEVADHESDDGAVR